MLLLEKRHSHSRWRLIMYFFVSLRESSSFGFLSEPGVCPPPSAGREAQAILLTWKVLWLSKALLLKNNEPP